MKLYDEVNDDSDGLAWLASIECESMQMKDFFVDPGHVISPRTLQTCKRCPVRSDCVTHAYNREYTAGYFGGLSPSFRKRNTLAEALEYIAEDPPEDPTR